jgi:hypothetical protein
MRLVNTVGCGAAAGGGCAAVICGLLAAAAWVAAMGGRPGLRVTGLDSFPAWVRPMYEDPRRITALTLALSVLVVLAGIGLLRKRQWGRRLAMAVAVAGLGWMVAAYPVSMRMAQIRTSKLPAVLGPLLAVFNSVVALAMVLVLLWLVRTLLRPEIKQQYR